MSPNLYTEKLKQATDMFCFNFSLWSKYMLHRVMAKGKWHQPRLD